LSSIDRFNFIEEYQATFFIIEDQECMRARSIETDAFVLYVSADQKPFLHVVDEETAEQLNPVVVFYWISIQYTNTWQSWTARSAKLVN
jgi:hypothetical protein